MNIMQKAEDWTREEQTRGPCKNRAMLQNLGLREWLLPRYRCSNPGEGSVGSVVLTVSCVLPIMQNRFLF